MSCSALIPPAWVACIQDNKCPGCAGPIMNDESKELLTQLRDAMIKMPNDPEGLAGWLMSTYDLRPKGTIEPTNFHRAPEVSSNTKSLKMANTPSNKFMKLANADKVMRDPKLAAIAEAIKTANINTGSMYGGVSDESVHMAEVETKEDQEQLLEEQMQAAAMLAKAQGKPLLMKDVLANNVIFSGMGGSAEPLSSQETALMQAVVGGAQVSEMDEINSLPPALQEDRLKRLSRQKDLLHSGSCGIIKRS